MTGCEGGLSILPMKSEDAPAAAALERLCFSDPWGEGEFAGIGENRLDRGFAAWRDGRLTGYVILRLVAGEGEILRIAVDPSERRKGTGRRLTEAAKAAARVAETEKIFLEVRAGNEAAIALYRSCGFKEYGVRKGYYRSPSEDALLMECTRP